MNLVSLDQARLDVVGKRRSNLFKWRGQFTPEFIEYLLGVFASPGQYVLDPFCGSGTVLLEAALQHLPAGGCEIHPAAYAMAKFLALSSIPAPDRVSDLEGVKSVVMRLSGKYQDLPLFQAHDEFRKRYGSLVDFAGDLFAAVKSGRELLLAVIVLIRAQGREQSGLIPAIYKACDWVKQDLLGLPYAETPIHVELCDARLTHLKFRGAADLIVTSPPYINVFNYHQNYRAILEAFGFDLLKVAESEIGANRKNRANRFRTVVQYALDMEQCLASLALSLRGKGLLVLVVGHQSNVRGIPFSNSAMLRDLAASLGCLDATGERHRVFTNRFGQPIREDIILLHNSGARPAEGAARKIAQAHLERALAVAHGDPRNDILSALSDVATIPPSPLFDRKAII